MVLVYYSLLELPSCLVRRYADFQTTRYMRCSPYVWDRTNHNFVPLHRGIAGLDQGIQCHTLGTSRCSSLALTTEWAHFLEFVHSCRGTFEPRPSGTVRHEPIRAAELEVQAFEHHRERTTFCELFAQLRETTAARRTSMHEFIDRVQLLVHRFNAIASGSIAD